MEGPTRAQTIKARSEGSMTNLNSLAARLIGGAIALALALSIWGLVA
jgi:hypothetical protein